jgi:hypothetical protein
MVVCFLSKILSRRVVFSFVLGYSSHQKQRLMCSPENIAGVLVALYCMFMELLRDVYHSSRRNNEVSVTSIEFRSRVVTFENPSCQLFRFNFRFTETGHAFLFGVRDCSCVLCCTKNCHTFHQKIARDFGEVLKKALQLRTIWKSTERVDREKGYSEHRGCNRVNTRMRDEIVQFPLIIRSTTRVNSSYYKKISFSIVILNDDSNDSFAGRFTNEISLDFFIRDSPSSGENSAFMHVKQK